MKIRYCPDCRSPLLESEDFFYCGFCETKTITIRKTDYEKLERISHAWKMSICGLITIVANQEEELLNDILKVK